MLVKTQSYYAALYDETSPVNVENFMNDLLSQAETDPRTKSLGLGGGLFIFNQYLIDRANRGELLAWALPLDGIFQCDAQLAHEMISPPDRMESLGKDHIVSTLRVPSGRLFVSCLGDLGMGKSPILRVDPGIYHVVLTRNTETESKHWALDCEADHLPCESPDWLIRLSRADGETL